MTRTLHQASSERMAVAMLLVACAFWGMSFNWNKEAQEMLTASWADAAPGAGDLGPASFLALRFPIAALLWFLMFPRSRKGWTASTLFGGLAGGAFLSSGMLFQHYGLALTSESLSAFLTSLTILFTPIGASLLLRHRISSGLWIAVAMATAGVALMTVYREEGRFELGALLGLLCAVVFSGHILIVDHFGKRDDPWRFTLAQFVVASLVFVGYTAWRGGPALSATAGVVSGVLNDARFVALLLAAVVFATLITFGLMFRYQPQTTPTRAALAYLTEPLFATVYAWVVAGRSISGVAIFGGLLIVLANLVAEIFGSPADKRHCDKMVALAPTGSDR